MQAMTEQALWERCAAGKKDLQCVICLTNIVSALFGRKTAQKMLELLIITEYIHL